MESPCFGAGSGSSSLSDDELKKFELCLDPRVAADCKSTPNDRGMINDMGDLDWYIFALQYSAGREASL
jgi:hypothetical protein